MLHLNPTTVRLGDALLDGVSLIVIDRAAARLAEEWTDLGPFAAMADAPEQRVTIRIVRRVTSDEPPLPAPGTMADLRFSTAPAASDAGRRTIQATTVLSAVVHQLPGDPGDGRASAPVLQTITLLAISPDGLEDPVLISPAIATDP